jgi:transposase InsO family protein
VSLAALIAAQRVGHGVPAAVSCRALGVSQAWFFKWRKGDRSPRRKRRAALAATIAYLFTRHNGTYGSPRITADLRAQGWRVSVNTVATLMAEQNLMARRVDPYWAPFRREASRAAGLSPARGPGDRPGPQSRTPAFARHDEHQHPLSRRQREHHRVTVHTNFRCSSSPKVTLSWSF